MLRAPRFRRASTAVVLVALAIGGCATNPVTGERQLSLYSEAEEIEMGNEAHEEILGSVGAYEEAPPLEAYVESLGRELAAASERPNLPWTFNVLDDASVNAFALPGGHVYVTRGLLAHLGSEAELAGVLGHEIGHVTARHGVHSASQEVLAAIGVGVLGAVSPRLGGLAGVTMMGFQVLFLKFSRADERQADDLGLRYMTKIGYDPRRYPDVFTVFQRLEALEGEGDLPGWLSTHPDPGARRNRLNEEIAALNQDWSGAKEDVGGYVRRLDGLVVGEDPRQGFFRNERFLHPTLRFQVDFPKGWETTNERTQVAATSSEGDAMMFVTLADEATPAAALDAFVGESGISVDRSWAEKVDGLTARWVEFTYTDPEDASELAGATAFVAHGENVFAVMALASPERWNTDGRAIEAKLGSFAVLRDREALAAMPRRLRLVEAPGGIDLAGISKTEGKDLEKLAVMNHVQTADPVPARQLVKTFAGK